MDALAALDDEFNVDDIPENSFEDVPNGKYEVQIKSAKLNRSKGESKRLQVSFGFIVLTGDCKGRHVFDHAGLDSENSISFFKGTLAKLGHEMPSSFQGLPPVLEELLDTFCIINVSTKGEFTNVRVERVLNEGDIELDEDLEEIDDVEEVEEEVEVEEEEFEVVKGVRVEVDFDGTMYGGVVKKVTDDSATIKFDDGSIEEVDLDVVMQEASEEAEEEEEVDDDDDGEDKLTLNFKTDDFTKKNKRVLKVLAEDNDFKVIDYDGDYLTLLEDVAADLEVTGSFDKPIKALNAMTVANEEE